MQDQWRLNRVTVSAGLRFDWLRESVEASSVPAACWCRAQSFPARTRTCQTGRTSTRGSASCGIRPAARRRRSSSASTATCSRPRRAWRNLFDRAARAQQRLARARRGPWGDPRRGNFLPDCDLRLNDGQRRVRRNGQPELRHERPGELAGSRLDHRLGQAALQLADVDQRRPRADAQPRRERRVLPHVVRQLPGDRQPARDAGRLQPLLRDRADGLRLAAQRPAAVRALRHQSRQRSDRSTTWSRSQERTASRRRSTTVST